MIKDDKHNDGRILEEWKRKREWKSRTLDFECRMPNAECAMRGMAEPIHVIPLHALILRIS